MKIIYNTAGRVIGHRAILSTDKSPTESSVDLSPDQPISTMEAELEKIELVRLSFPSFSDGRAFTQARLLRNRYGFKGDIRASGEIVQDQLAFMIACGFTQFEISSDAEPLDLEKARIDAHRFGNFLAGTASTPLADLQRTGT